MSPRIISPLGVGAIIALAFTNTASALVIDDDINQIEGTVAFSNGPLLGVTSISLSGGSTAPGPLGEYYSSSTSASVSGNSGAYSLTAVANGFTHNVSPSARLDGNKDWYSFEAKVSPAVPDEPAPAVALDFSECAGFASFEFYHEDSGAPFLVDHAGASARPEVSAGAFAGAQASTDSSGATTGESFTVRGDGKNYRIDVSYKIGALWFSHSEDRVITCDDAAEPIRIPLSGKLEFEPGSIDGYVNMNYFTELADSVMYAVNGPAGNSGADVLSSPTYGNFLIENLVPSDLVSPADPYTVYAQLHFDTTFGIEYFRSPSIEVSVPDGATAHTSSAFNIMPGILRGNVNVRAPKFCADVANVMQRSAGGPEGGSASANLNKTVGPDPLGKASMRGLSAYYRLGVGVPGNDPGGANWGLGYTGTFWRADASPDLHVNQSYGFHDYKAPSALVKPLSNTTVNVQHCLAAVFPDVVINDGDTSGSSFNQPHVTYNGSYNGSDGVSYYAAGDAYGTPLSTEARAQQGRVNMCIPEGTYNFDTDVLAEDENGVVGSTRIQRVSHTIECGALVNPLVVTVDADPVCKGATSGAIEATAKGFYKPIGVSQMYAVLNCEADDITTCPDRIQICGGSLPACGVDPELSFNIPTTNMVQCGNTVQVVALDEVSGRVSHSGSEPFAYEATGPIGTGCNDVVTTYDNVLGGGRIDLEHVIEPLNDCGLEVSSGNCYLYNSATRKYAAVGADVVLPAGNYDGFCQVKTACGTQTCGFDASVR